MTLAPLQWLQTLLSFLEAPQSGGAASRKLVTPRYRVIFLGAYFHYAAIFKPNSCAHDFLGKEPIMYRPDRPDLMWS
jgi:hypothetical protein